MIFKFPEYGSLRWHGVLNQAWKCIFQKLEKYTPGGQTKIGSYYISNILYSLNKDNGFKNVSKSYVSV